MTLTILGYILDRIPSISAAIVALLALLATLRNSRRLTTLKVEIDGRMEQFLTLTKAAAHAEGVLKEKADRAELDKAG